jgi:KTSC domain-containing protein
MPSSVISYIKYDDQSHTLFVTFVSGVKYAYQKVPYRIYQAFRTASSKGRYLNENIKGSYPFIKLDDLKVKKDKKF